MLIIRVFDISHTHTQLLTTFIVMPWPRKNQRGYQNISNFPILINMQTSKLSPKSYWDNIWGDW